MIQDDFVGLASACNIFFRADTKADEVLFINVTIVNPGQSCASCNAVGFLVSFMSKIARAND